MSFPDAISKIASMKTCCSKSDCFLKCFVCSGHNDQYVLAASFLMKCRDETRNKDKAERDKFLINHVKNAIKQGQSTVEVVSSGGGGGGGQYSAAGGISSVKQRFFAF